MKLNRGRPPRYDFGSLAVDKHFDVFGIDSASLRSCASNFGKRHNMAFSVRKIDGGYRVWRVK